MVDPSMIFTSCLSFSHIIGVAILSLKSLNRIIHNRINYSCTICVWERERERERILLGVFVKFCVGMNLPLVPEEGLFAYTKLCLCFYLFIPTPRPLLMTISYLNQTPQNFSISENSVFNFIYQVKQKTLCWKIYMCAAEN